MARGQKLGLNTRTIIIFISLAMIISGAFLIISDPDRIFVTTVELFDEPPTGGADASGTISIVTILRGTDGSVVRQYTPTSALQGALLDPESNEVIKSYTIRLSWVTNGTNINWDSLLFTGEIILKSYIGVGVYGQAKEKVLDSSVGSVSKNVNQTGLHDFTVSDIEALMPDIIADTEIVEDPITGEFRQRGVGVPQKTIEAHAIAFIFKGTFSMSVFDLYGNEHKSPFDLDIELKLNWPGSEFNVEWNKQGTMAGSVFSVTRTSPPAGAILLPDFEYQTIGVSNDMTDLESDEFINVLPTKDGVYTGSIFGGGVSEDVGFILLMGGGFLIVLVVVFPNVTQRRK